MSIQETAKKGNRLDTLIALRDRLAELIDGSDSPKEIAGLTRAIQGVLREIQDVELMAGVSSENDFEKFLGELK